MADVPTIRPVPQLPELRWNAKAGRYISKSGRFVSQVQVRNALDSFITTTTGQMNALGQSLVRADITLAEFQTSMMALSKQANLAGAALERGGWYQMSQADFGRVGAKVRGEYAYLNRFATEVATGAQPLNGVVPMRAQMYGQQARVTYYDFAAQRAEEDGFRQEKSVLNPGESCDVCIQEDRKGWSPIGSLVPIGERTCLSNCRCYMEYRDSRGSTRSV